MKTYRVATFYHLRSGRSPLVTAYTRDYNPSWDGCVMFEVEATNGTVAKRRAIRLRREFEATKAGERALHLRFDHLRMLRHALGLDQARRSYRNHYCANVGDERCAALATAGLFERVDTGVPVGGLETFRVSDLGKVFAHERSVCADCDNAIATEDHDGEPLCAGCYDSIGEREDEREIW